MTFNEFKVGVEIKQNRLLCEIIIEEKFKYDLKCAFYLLANGKKIKQQDYSYLNKADFWLEEDGEYQIIGFIMYQGNRYINKSECIQFTFDERYPIIAEDNKKLSFAISIFGSCVSRDLLEYDVYKEIDLRTYIARQSIVSAVSEPLDIDIENINLESPFKKRCIYNDFRKNSFELLEVDNSEYLLIDLIDERFKLVKYRNGKKYSWVTYSSELQESEYIKRPNLVDKKLRVLFKQNKYYVGNKRLEQYLDIFCNKILAIYPEENIIIHKCKLTQYYLNEVEKITEFPKNYHRYIINSNRVLEYMYSYLLKRLPKARVIDISDKYYADINHKWGLAPMHYQKEYYFDVLDQIKSYLYCKIMKGNIYDVVK